MMSYWLESTKDNRKEFDKLEKDINTDVCIIGGGLTGLTTAYYLKNSGLNVVLLEKDKLCNHTSGNTTAKITSQHHLFYKYLVDSKGKEFAKQYLKANEEAIKNIETIIKEENIQCDFEYQDSYVFTQKLDEISKIKDEIEALKSIGFDSEFVEQIELPIKILGAIKFKKQAQFHPLKYAIGLVNAMPNINIYENTKVVELKKEEERYIVITEKNYKINCKHVVIATHYPIINVPGYYFLKMYQSMSYLIAIKTNEKSFNGMYINSEEPTISFRRQDDLILIGGNDHKTGAKIDLSNAYKFLEDIAKNMYPDCEIKYRWHTEDCISLDKIPYIGKFSSIMPNVYVGTGYKKWGMTFSNIAGKIISDMILEKINKCQEIFKATRIEPIKNIKEVENMLKETTHSLLLNKLDIPKATIEDIKNDEGKIVEVDGNKVGIYKDKEGNLFAIKPVCTHLGCELSWNNLAKTWDCPCHGSRFTYTGESIYEPSIKNLKLIN